MLDYPQLVDKGVYVAGTLSPSHQKRKWYNYAASLWVVKWLLPKEMRSSNYEMMHLASSLKENRGRHNEIHQPLVLIQGTKDFLVPFETVHYYKEQMPSGVKYMIEDGMNHFVPWSDPELIVEAIVDEYDVNREQCESDVRELLGQLVEAELVRVEHAAAS